MMCNSLYIYAFVCGVYVNVYFIYYHSFVCQVRVDNLFALWHYLSILAHFKVSFSCICEVHFTSCVLFVFFMLIIHLISLTFHYLHVCELKY